MPATRTAPPRVDPSRTYSDRTVVHGRHVEPGTELTVDGIRGRVRFTAHVRHENGAEWIDVVTSRGFARSVRPDAVRTVHVRHRLGKIA